MSYRRILLISIIVGICACDLLRGSGAGVLLEPEVPEDARRRFDGLVATALDRAVVRERDIPDYRLLKDADTIVLSNETGTGDPITPAALPHSDDVSLVLASPEHIQEVADAEGDFLYLQVGSVDAEGDRGVITLSTTWARAKQSDLVYLSGGGYELQFRWDGDSWRFVKMVSAWIS